MRLGEWNLIEVHYRMNTPGVEDGVFEGWLWNSDYPDGVRGAYHDNVQYRDGDHGELAINQLQLAHYYGGLVGPADHAIHVLRRLRHLVAADRASPSVLRM